MTDLEFANWGINYLENKGVSFTEDGFPIIKNEWLAETKPKIMIPFNKKNRCFKIRGNTSIVFFCDDRHLYPRLETILKDVDSLREFHSIVSMDISVSYNMPIEVQRFHMLINLIYTAILGVNGIKIIPSLRCGEELTIPILLAYENPLFWAIGAVGCQKNPKNSYEECLFASKLQLLSVSSIVSYGKLNIRNKMILNRFGISVNEYEDFRSISYRKEAK